MEYIKEALVLSMAASHSPVSVDYGGENWTSGSGSKAWNPTADAGKNTGEWNKLINERDLLIKNVNLAYRELHDLRTTRHIPDALTVIRTGLKRDDLKIIDGQGQTRFLEVIAERDQLLNTLKQIVDVIEALKKMPAS
jgi:hypothetical protein